MNRSDRLRVQHIFEAIAAIEEYTTGITFDVFRSSPLHQDAAIKQLIIIGEAINGLSEQFRDEHSDIPFREIIGMRNRLIHEYMLVSEATVWKTCTQDVLELKRALDNRRL